MAPRSRARARAFGHLLAGLLFLILAVAPVWAQDVGGGPVIVTVTGAETPEVIDKLFDAAVKQGRPVEFRIAATPAADKGVASTLELDRTGWSILRENLSVGVEYGWDALPHIAELPGDLAEAYAAIRNRGDPARAMGVAVALVLGSAAVGFAVMRLCQRLWPITRRDWQPQDGLIARTLAGAALLAVNLIGLGLFLLLSQHLRARLLPIPDLAQQWAEGFEALATGFIAYSAAAEFLLAPHHPERRLLPLPHADRHYRNLRLYGLAAPFVFGMADFFARIGSSPLALAGWFSLAGGAIAIFKLWWFWTARRDIAAVCRGPGEAGPGRRLMAALLPPFLIASAVLTWAVGRIAAVAPDGARWADAVGVTQILLVLMPLAAAGAAALVEEFVARTDRHTAANPLLRAWGMAAATVSGALVWVLGLWFLGHLWQFFLLEIFSRAQVAALEGPVAVIAVLLVGWIVWTFLEALFSAYAPKTRAALSPAAEDAPGESGVQSRFGTILPLVRGVVLAGVLAVTVLSALSRLGLDIAPLLAGFGIIGLAISFGSQPLVRDIVSGIFFIADDAFRVGEYIDTGKLKGTVERITLRSVQLRHQSGLVHTIPFGQIASVTNSSRDWATVKFNIRLERETDIELARKTIKRLGLAMLEDPELGPEMILPLKLQGVAEIADSALVLRLKFTSKPERASWVQREALKRTFAALREAGIDFASNAVTVKGGDAANGAAVSSVTQPPVSPVLPV